MARVLCNMITQTVGWQDAAQELPDELPNDD
jgi:hypothetical protein